MKSIKATIVNIMKNNLVKKTGFNVLLLICCCGFLFAFTNCASKPKSPDAASSSESSQNDDGVKEALGNSSLEEAKQKAEAAEWEAHRLREELYRQKKGN